MEKGALEYLPVFFGLISVVGFLGIITCTWCARHRRVWAFTGASCIVTALACVYSRIVDGGPHFMIGVTFFVFGVVLVRRALRPFQRQQKRAAV